MGLKLFVRDTFKRWLKTLHKNTDLNGSDVQNPSLLLLGYILRTIMPLRHTLEMHLDLPV
jgi:hypothetical protein